MLETQLELYIDNILFKACHAVKTTPYKLNITFIQCIWCTEVQFVRLAMKVEKRKPFVEHNWIFSNIKSYTGKIFKKR